MRWMLNLDGGPRRVNHAAVAIGDKIYSFGGYSANEMFDNQGDFIDIHVLNTFTYRWERLPTFSESDRAAVTTKQRSVTIGASGGERSSSNAPSTSSGVSSSYAIRRRTRSLSDLHPLAQLRATNPPLLDEPNSSHNRQRLPDSVSSSASSASSSSSSLGGLMENAMLCMTRRRHQQQQQVQAVQQPNSLRNRVIVEEEGEADEEHLQRMGMEVEGTGNERQRIRAMLDHIVAEMSSDESDEDYEEENSSTDSAMTEEMDSAPSDEDEIMHSDDEDYEPMELAGPDDYEEEDEDGEVNPVDDLVMLAKIHQHPEIPFKRYGHTVVPYKGLIYLWGGRNDKLGCNQKLHCYNPAKNRWSVVPTEGQCPPARDGHTAVVDGDQMYVFGGFEEKEHRFSQETYAFHFPSRTWKKLKCQGDPPQYRDFHAACVLDGKMYVFGGRSDEMGQMHTSHDVYCNMLHFFDLRTHRWHQPKLALGSVPCGRRSHTMWTYQGAIYLFGGYQSIRNVHFADLWRFDPAQNRWTPLKPSGQGPSARRRMCTVLAGNRIFLFGGTMPSANRRNVLSDLGDLYVLDFAPTLASLCLQAILKNGLLSQAENALPSILTKELHYMNTPNKITKSHMPPPDHMIRG